MLNIFKDLFSKEKHITNNDEILLTEWEKAHFYQDVKEKDNKQLHKIAFEQMAETACFSSDDKGTLLKLFWENWENPANTHQFLKQLNEAIQDFEWGWFDKWNAIFLETGNYPYNWTKFKAGKATEKSIKIALFYYSVYFRFAALRRYRDHYTSLEECTWSKKTYRVRLSILDDDVVEKEIVNSMNIIQDNVILALPPYVPAGRVSIMYERIRNC